MSSPTSSHQSGNLWTTLEGQIVDGKYHLDHLLSSGSYGGVFAADEVVEDKMIRRLAIKLITPDPEYPERQMQELILATSMDHPNILRCFSPGVCTVNGVRLLYIAMELASISLFDCFVDGVMGLNETLALAQGMLSALIYLGGGDRPLVHRDIKPANILQVNGVWKLADFGLLRGIGPEKVAQTRTLLGTAEYAPPEAFEGAVSTAWDMWSLGVVLVEALTGALPFDAPTRQELQNEIMNAEARNVDGLTGPIESIIRGCLLKERTKRWTPEEALGVLRGTASAPIIPVTFSGDNLLHRRASYPFRFKYGSADTIPELIKLCEEYPLETQDYLLNRYFAKWLGDAMNDPGLAREAVGYGQLHWHEPEHGVELFIRELRSLIGLPIDPQLSSVLSRLDFGLCRVGEQASADVEYRCNGRRAVWGSIALDGNLPGIQVEQTFTAADKSALVTLDLADVEPGYYEGALVLQPNGLTSNLRLPISYTVMPLKVKIAPKELNFGSVDFGEICARRIDIQTDSARVKVKGSATIVPPCPGITVEGSFQGSMVSLNVVADCRQIEADRDYVRRVILETNAGRFQIPLRLRVRLARTPIVRQVLVGGVVGSLIAGLLRNTIEMIGGTVGHWFLVYPGQTQYTILLRLLGSPVLAFVTGYLYRLFVRWRWPLIFERGAGRPIDYDALVKYFRLH